MQINLYSNFLNQFITTKEFEKKYFESISIITNAKRLFFIGNGGSNAVCSHMAEDYQKIGRYPTFCFSDPALITCYSNDYGYEFALKEWLKIHFTIGDVLIAISSSGESKNIINAVKYANTINNNCITLSGFKQKNNLSRLGRENIHLPIENYGIVECLHDIILHSILDEIAIINN